MFPTPVNPLRIHDSYRQKPSRGQCKSIRTCSQSKNCSMVFASHASRSFPAHRVLPFPRGGLAKPSRKNCLRSGTHERIMPPGGGGYEEMYRRKHLESTAQKTSAGLAWKRGQPAGTEKTDTHRGNFYFPGADHSAVLRDCNCDSSVAQYSRSEASSA